MVYSPAVRVDNLVYVSGQLGPDAQAKIVGARDVRTQARQCFQNIGGVLKAMGPT